jgi:glutathione S-transferase
MFPLRIGPHHQPVGGTGGVMLKLYDYPDCPFCQKVRVVLKEKDLEYETIFIDLRKGEQKKPDFLRLNPLGKVPVLIDEDVVLFESTIINEYLEDEYPHPGLLPEDSAARGHIRLLEDHCDNFFIPPTAVLLYELYKPEAERDAQRIAQSREDIRRSLAFVNEHLGSGEYLGGSQFTLADAAFAPRAILLNRLSVEVDASMHAVSAWIERLKTRPSVQALGLL